MGTERGSSTYTWLDEHYLRSERSQRSILSRDGEYSGEFSRGPPPPASRAVAASNTNACRQVRRASSSPSHAPLAEDARHEGEEDQAVLAAAPGRLRDALARGVSAAAAIVRREPPSPPPRRRHPPPPPPRPSLVLLLHAHLILLLILAIPSSPPSSLPPIPPIRSPSFHSSASLTPSPPPFLPPHSSGTREQQRQTMVSENGRKQANGNVLNGIEGGTVRYRSINSTTPHNGTITNGHTRTTRVTHSTAGGAGSLSAAVPYRTLIRSIAPIRGYVGAEPGRHQPQTADQCSAR